MSLFTLWLTSSSGVAWSGDWSALNKGILFILKGFTMTTTSMTAHYLPSSTTPCCQVLFICKIKLFIATTNNNIGKSHSRELIKIELKIVVYNGEVTSSNLLEISIKMKFADTPWAGDEDEEEIKCKEYKFMGLTMAKCMCLLWMYLLSIQCRFIVQQNSSGSNGL